MKKFWFGVLVIGIPLALLAQSIRWYNDPAIPQKTVMTGSEIVSFQQTSPNAYRWALLSDVRTYMGGSGSAPVTIIYSTTINVQTNYITNGFITYLTVNSNAYFNSTNFVSYEFTTNLYVTTNIANYSFETNLYATYLTVQSNATFLETNYNNYEITTNLYVTQDIVVETNVTVNQTITTKNLTVQSNITYLAATPTTNAWANGPTGNVDLAISDQNYSASADMALTGVVNKSNTVVQNVLLTILATGANRTIFMTGAFAESTGATSYVCTNGVPREIWIRYTPALGGWTNVCSLPFYRP